MNPINFKGAIILGAPKDWNPERDGECVGLPVVITRLEGGITQFTSLWKPTDKERADIARGENIAISCYGHQVPIYLSTLDKDGPIVCFAHERANSSNQQD